MIVNKERLHYRAFELDLSLPDLAKQSGVSLATLSKWLGGAKPASASLTKLAQALSVSPEWLLDSAPPPKRNQEPSRSTEDRVARLVVKIQASNLSKLDLDFLLDHLLTAVELRVNELK